MVARTRLNVTLYEQYTACLVIDQTYSFFIGWFVWFPSVAEEVKV